MYQYGYSFEPNQLSNYILNLYQSLSQYNPTTNLYQPNQQYTLPSNAYQPTEQYAPSPTVYQSNAQYAPSPTMYQPNAQYATKPIVSQYASKPIISSSPQQHRSTSRVYQPIQSYSPIPIIQQPLQQYDVRRTLRRPKSQHGKAKYNHRTFSPVYTNGKTLDESQLSKSSSNLLLKHCQTIRQKAQVISTKELQQLLDKIHDELKNVDDSEENIENIRELVLALIPVKPSILKGVAQHTIFYELRSPLIHLLRQWQRESSLKEDNVFLFRSIIKLITKLLKNTEEFNQYPSWLFNPALLELIATCLTNIGKSGQFLNENNKRESRSFIRLFAIYNKYQIALNKAKTFNKDVLTQLIDPIVQCLMSSHYIDVFSQIKTNKKSMKIQENFFLHNCPSFLTSYDGSRLEQIMESLLSTMLPHYLTIFDELISFIHQWKPSIMRAVNQLIKLIDHGPTTPKILATHLPLIDHVLTIVDTSSLYNKLVANLSNPETILMNTAVHFLANMLNEPAVLAHIKQKKMTSSFLRLTSARYEPLVYDTYTILALTTSEKDINEMRNPGMLLSTVIRSLKKGVLDNESDDQTNISQLLEILKGLSQHDQMKEEIFKQNELTFLLECTKKFTGDVLTLLLETIWTLAFSQTGALQIRQNPDFLQSIQSISKTSTDEALKKASDGLVWKLVQEPAFLEKIAKNQKEQSENAVEKEIETTEVIIGPDGKEQIVKKIRRVSVAPAEQTFQYDMMISYCHADKDLIYKIHQFLLEQGFKIWIDLNNMFGPAMSAMAEAVENSEFVLLCMSDSYKQSTYCQAEAEYAFGCKRRLVPLIVRPGYKADGWLGFMIGSRIYIDFGRFDFDTGCEKLMHEIAQQRKRPLPSKEVKVTQQEKPEAKIPTIEVTTEKPIALSPRPVLLSAPPLPSPTPTPFPSSSPSPSSTSGKLPDIYTNRRATLHYKHKHIDDWVESDVLDFLFNNHIHEFMPLCEKMDGRALIQLYKMSISHSKSIYALLNDELKSAYQVKVPIGIFTRFLSVMERLGASHIQTSSSITQVEKQPQAQAPIMSSRVTSPTPLPVRETVQTNTTQPSRRYSTQSYDMFLTSDAPPSEVLQMAIRWFPRFQLMKPKQPGQPLHIS